MKKCVMFLLGLVVSSSASFAAIVQVPWDEANQRYYLKWEGYSQIVSGNYDPDVTSGTYQKQNGDKWIATNWAGNYGQWTYQFVGGPAGNKIDVVTVNELCYQQGTNTYHFAQFSTDGTAWSTIFSLGNGTAAARDWRGNTFGSNLVPLNVDTIYVKDTMYNGNFTTAVQNNGMEIIATAVPEPSLMMLLIASLAGMSLRRRKTV